MAVVMDFWCDTCHQWRKPAFRERNPRCTVCGEGFACGECGHEIDMQGNCLRAEAGAGTCPSGTR